MQARSTTGRLQRGLFSKQRLGILTSHACPSQFSYGAYHLETTTLEQPVPLKINTPLITLGLF